MKISICLILLFSTGQAFAESDRKSVSVSGQCLKTVIPDRGRVTIVAEVRNKNAGVAARDVQELYKKVHDDVKRLKLKDQELETSEYNVFEDTEYNDGKRVSKGYYARMGLEVSTTEIERLGELIEVAAKREIRRVGGLQPYVSQEKMKKEYEECLDEAMKNARSKADRIAKAGGSSVGEVLQVTEGGGGGHYQPVYAEAMMDGDMAGGRAAKAAPIESKGQKITVDVSARFSLK